MAKSDLWSAPVSSHGRRTSGLMSWDNTCPAKLIRDIFGRLYEIRTLEHAMQRLFQTFSTKISPAQSMKLFTAPKAGHISWMDHFLYLTAVSDACAGTDMFLLDYIVHYADPHMQTTVLFRLDMHRTDPYATERLKNKYNLRSRR